MGKDKDEVKVAEVVEAPEETAAPVAVVKSDLSMLMTEASSTGRSGSGDGIMGKFKDRLKSVLNEAVTEAKGGEVAPLPAGAVVRFFLKHTTIFESLPKDDRYNRAYRYLSQAKKSIAQIGWDMQKLGKDNYLVYTAKV